MSLFFSHAIRKTCPSLKFFSFLFHTLSSSAPGASPVLSRLSEAASWGAFPYTPSGVSENARTFRRGGESTARSKKGVHERRYLSPSSPVICSVNTYRTLLSISVRVR